MQKKYADPGQKFLFQEASLGFILAYPKKKWTG